MQPVGKLLVQGKFQEHSSRSIHVAFRLKDGDMAFVEEDAWTPFTFQLQNVVSNEAKNVSVRFSVNAPGQVDSSQKVVNLGIGEIEDVTVSFKGPDGVYRLTYSYSEISDSGAEGEPERAGMSLFTND